MFFKNIIKNIKKRFFPLKRSELIKGDLSLNYIEKNLYRINSSNYKILSLNYILNDNINNYLLDYFISSNNLKFNIELGNNVVSNLPTKFSFLSLNQIISIKRNYSMLENNNRFVLVKIKYEDLTRLRVANKIELVTWINDRLKFSS